MPLANCVLYLTSHFVSLSVSKAYYIHQLSLDWRVRQMQSYRAILCSIHTLNNSWLKHRASGARTWLHSNGMLWGTTRKSANGLIIILCRTVVHFLSQQTFFTSSLTQIHSMSSKWTKHQAKMGKQLGMDMLWLQLPRDPDDIPWAAIAWDYCSTRSTEQENSWQEAEMKEKRNKMTRLCPLNASSLLSCCTWVSLL